MPSRRWTSSHTTKILSKSALSKHLTLLADAGYVHQDRVLQNSRNRLWLSLTPEGVRAYTAHTQALQQIIAAYRRPISWETLGSWLLDACRSLSLTGATGAYRHNTNTRTIEDPPAGAGIEKVVGDLSLGLTGGHDDVRSSR